MALKQVMQRDYTTFQRHPFQLFHVISELDWGYTDRHAPYLLFLYYRMYTCT